MEMPAKTATKMPKTERPVIAPSAETKNKLVIIAIMPLAIPDAIEVIPPTNISIIDVNIWIPVINNNSFYRFITQYLVLHIKIIYYI